MAKITEENANPFIDMNDKVEPKKVEPQEILTTHYLFVLDRSGSMECVADATVEGFNKNVEKIKKLTEEYKNQEFFVSVVLFNHEQEVALWRKPADELKPMTVGEYNPRGYTALYDTVGINVAKLRSELSEDLKNPNVKIMVTIFTDGMDNQSKEYTSDKIALMNEDLKKTEQWTFSYVGANQDVAKVAKSMNIPMSNAMFYSPSAQGVKCCFDAQSDALGKYAQTRSFGGSVAMNMYSKDEEVTDLTKETDEEIAARISGMLNAGKKKDKGNKKK